MGITLEDADFEKNKKPHATSHISNACGGEMGGGGPHILGCPKRIGVLT